MKLQILITQYDETQDVIKPMLDSIAAQQGVDFDDVGVLIGNDGSTTILPEPFLQAYPFKVRYLLFDHRGLPGCRANLFDASSAEFVMFCDADDMFLSAVGLHTIFAYMRRGFDALTSQFYEEIRRGQETDYLVKEHDSTFVHGKVFRRDFLTANGIVWHADLEGHEDSCFNTLAIRLAGSRHRYCPVPFYLWRWRDDSICRRDPLYIPHTYPYMVDSGEHLIADFLARGRRAEAAESACHLLYYSYYVCQKPVWDGQTELRRATMRRLAAFRRRYGELIKAFPARQLATLIAREKRRATEHDGVLMERQTFAAWLDEMEDSDHD